LRSVCGGKNRPFFAEVWQGLCCPALLNETEVPDISRSKVAAPLSAHPAGACARPFVQQDAVMTPKTGPLTGWLGGCANRLPTTMSCVEHLVFRAVCRVWAVGGSRLLFFHSFQFVAVHERVALRHIVVPDGPFCRDSRKRQHNTWKRQGISG